MSDTRKLIASAIFDPGATEGHKGDRTLTEWQTDAVMRALSSRSAEAGKPVVKTDAAVERLSELRLSVRIGGETNPYTFTETDDDGDYVTFEDACAVLLSALSTPADIEPVAWRARDEKDSEKYWHYFTKKPRQKSPNEIWEPLYAAPVADIEPVSVPDGWQLVPKEPTPEMIASGEDEITSGRHLVETYKDMLAAAPHPTKTEAVDAEIIGHAEYLEACAKNEPSESDADRLWNIAQLLRSFKAPATSGAVDADAVFGSWWPSKDTGVKSISTQSTEDADAVIERLTKALEKISSPTQSTELLWWQIEARAALKSGRSQP